MAAGLLLVATSGCGLVLATPPENTTLPKSLRPVNTIAPKVTTPADVVITTTSSTTLPTRPPVRVGERTIQDWENIKGNSILAVCDEADVFAISGARVANVGSTNEVRYPELTRAEQAAARAELRKLVGSAGELKRLLAEADVVPTDPAALDAAIADLDSLAQREPDDGDVRLTLGEWSLRHEAVISDLVARISDLCPTGMLAQIVAWVPPPTS